MINLDVKDNHEEAAIGGKLALDLCQKVSHVCTLYPILRNSFSRSIIGSWYLRGCCYWEVLTVSAAGTHQWNQGGWSWTPGWLSENDGLVTLWCFDPIYILLLMVVYCLLFSWHWVLRGMDLMEWVDCSLSWRTLGRMKLMTSLAVLRSNTGDDSFIPFAFIDVTALSSNPLDNTKLIVSLMCPKIWLLLCLTPYFEALSRRGFFHHFGRASSRSDISARWSAGWMSVQAREE